MDLLKKHWDMTYEKSEINQSGWYEIIPEKSLELIDKCNLSKSASILDVGSGASTLIGELLTRGHENIVVNDISSVALNKAKLNIPKEYKDKINWICGDITDTSTIKNIPGLDLWHDRTVLHFLITAEKKKKYKEAILEKVKKSGFVIISVFAIGGAKKCSGLDVCNYDVQMLREFLGEEFHLISSFNHVYIQPSGGKRPFIYTLFKRL